MPPISSSRNDGNCRSRPSIGTLPKPRKLSVTLLGCEAVVPVHEADGLVAHLFSSITLPSSCESEFSDQKSGSTSEIRFSD